MTLAILGNTAVLAMERADASPSYAAALEDANLYFTYLFVAEMGAKLIALGCQGYWTDGFNMFDGVIVLFSLAEIIIAEAASSVDLGFNPRVQGGYHHA